MRTFVGNYKIGYRPVQLFVDTNLPGGSVTLVPEDGKPTSIEIGIGCHLTLAMSTLLHEAYELALIDLNTRYEPQPAYSSESSDFIFVMTHNQLGEAHDRVGEFLIAAFPKFNKAYEKHSKH